MQQRRSKGLMTHCRRISPRWVPRSTQRVSADAATSSQRAAARMAGIAHSAISHTRSASQAARKSVNARRRGCSSSRPKKAAVPPARPSTNRTLVRLKTRRILRTRRRWWQLLLGAPTCHCRNSSRTCPHFWGFRLSSCPRPHFRTPQKPDPLRLASPQGLCLQASKSAAQLAPRRRGFRSFKCREVYRGSRTRRRARRSSAPQLPGASRSRRQSSPQRRLARCVRSQHRPRPPLWS
mmetsp:Transcript_123461/g.348890  ORF Transcript_123461/g.348890 Transcript_123461/m.348890 type:complete len:237 (+) Transcript_123461:1251-1961(+)